MENQRWCGRFVEEWPGEGGATPWAVEVLLRSAMGAVTGTDPAELPDAEPRRTAKDRAGDYATALPLRTARSLGASALELAEAMAAKLRSCPHVVEATVEGAGFVGIELTPRTRVSLVCGAAEGAGYLTGAVSRGRRPEGAEGPWKLSALHRAGDLAQAYRWAREDARRRMAAAVGGPAEGGPAKNVPNPSLAADIPFPAGDTEAGWRDPYLDAPLESGGEVGRLLTVIGAAAARIAFCRSVPEHPRPGEETGPRLPALPTAEHPGDWIRHTDANPAFAIRYAHAHALSVRRWAREAGHAPGAVDPGQLTGAAVAALEEPSAAALLGAVFDGPGVLRTAARRGAPHILVRYLESLAIAYHEWREDRSVSTGTTTGRAMADDACRQAADAELELCAATAGVLRTGLSVIGVSAPTRL
ncbi:MAG: DALR anticodon-binding domain-containing protein [Nocardiopsaceae bacterium]|nr:DALR anticodon-binding domain-containing protein [Nocardiopsaceae bacterium]